jgi:hypothetical protein
MPLGLQFNNWTTAMVEGNLFAPLPGTYVIALNQTQTSLNAWWNYNTYICDPTGGQILFDTSPYSFDGWQQLTGYDQDSLFVVGDLHGTKVFLLPNDYEVGRANIAVYNWDNLGTVSVDVKSVLPMGTRFEVRNAQDFYSPPVLSGIYHGQRLMLPMSNLTVAAPNARLLTPPPTGPTFNVFVLLPLPPPLQIVLAGDNVQVSWPIGLDINVLQSAQGLVNPVTWVNATNAPVVYQDRYMISEPVRSSQKYYRLRPQ